MSSTGQAIDRCCAVFKIIIVAIAATLITSSAFAAGNSGSNPVGVTGDASSLKATGVNTNGSGITMRLGDVVTALSSATEQSGAAVKSFLATPSGLSYSNMEHGNWPIVSNYSNITSGAFEAPDALEIGGQKLPFTYEQSGQSSQGAMGSLVITNQPWGPINAGCSLCILWGSGNQQESGIANQDWRPGSNNVTAEDAAAEYIGTYNSNALMIIPIASYTATTAVPVTPLSPRQMAMLRVGMYISTNSIDGVTPTGLQTNAAGELTLPATNYYHGVITGWASDGSTINVATWKTGQKQSSNNVPSTVSASLDTYWTNYGSPQVFIGNSYNTSARNEYLTYDGTRSNTTANGGHATAISHNALADEIDLRYYATHPNEVNMSGIVISVAGTPGTPVGRAALTQDSTAMTISGDIHHSLTIDEPSDGNPIESHSFWAHGYQGVQTGTNTVAPSFSFTTEADSSKENLIGYMFKEDNTHYNYQAASYHLGLHYDGDVNNPTTAPNSAGELVWNALGAEPNSLSICSGYGGIGNLNCGLTQHQNGSTSFANPTLFGAANSGVAWQHISIPSTYNNYGWQVDKGNVPVAYLDNNSVLKTINGAQMSIGGIAGGKNGLTVGSQIAGNVAAAGVYAASNYGNNILEVYKGTTPLMSMDNAGNLYSKIGFNSTGTSSFFSNDSALHGAVFPVENYNATSWNQGFINPNTMFLGGTGELADGALGVRNSPYGSLQMGSTLSVISSDRPVSATREGIGPNGVTQQGQYNGNDYVNIYGQTEPLPPRILASSAITAQDGLAHTVTYDATHAFFSPSISASLIPLLHDHMHIMTNSLGPLAHVSSKPNGWITLNTEGGDLQSWTLDASGNVSSITVDGWTEPNVAYVSGTIPSANYDTVNSSFTVPAVWFGAESKAFLTNFVCHIGHNDAGTPGTNDPLGNKYSLVHNCDNEWDFNQDSTETPYKNHFAGLTMVMNSNGVPVSSDSYGVQIAGAWPTDLFISDAQANAKHIAAQNFLVQGPAGTGLPLGNTGQELMEISGYVDGAVNYCLQTYLDKDSSTTGQGSMRIALQEACTQGVTQSAPGGNLQSQLVYNPNGIGGSIGLFGYNGTGLIVNGGGNVTGAGSLTATTAINAATASISGATVTHGITSYGSFTSNNNGLYALGSQVVGLGWNGSGGGGEADLLVPGDAGTTKGFSIYQAGAANTTASMVSIFHVDSSNLNYVGTANLTNQVNSGDTYLSGSHEDNITVKTTAYDPGIGDCGKTFRYNVSTATTITIGVGAFNGSKFCKIYFEQGGTGTLTFVGGSGEGANQLGTSPTYTTTGLNAFATVSIDTPTSFTVRGDVGVGGSTIGTAGLTLNGPLASYLPANSTVPWLAARPSNFMNNGSGDDLLPDNDLMIGGLTANPSAAAGKYAQDGHTHIQADLDGAGETGTLTTSINAPDSYFYHRPITTGYGDSYDLANSGLMPSVAHYDYNENVRPRFVANGEIKDAEGNAHTVTYDGYKAYFSPALPPEWVAKIHKEQYLMTNSLIPSPITPLDPTSYHPNNVYAGLVNGWDPNGAWISTYGWAPLGGSYVSNQAPSTNYDTFLSQFPDATLFVGAPTGMFEQNGICQLNPSDSAGGNSYLSMSRSCVRDEWDVFFNPGKDYYAGVQGYTIAFQPGQTPANGGVPAHPTKPNSGSYLINLDGGAVMPNIAHFHGAGVGGKQLYGDGYAFDNLGNLTVNGLTSTGPTLHPLTSQSSSYTLQASDCGNTVRETSSSAATITVPTGLTVGCEVKVIQAGAGALTYVGASGMTVEQFGSSPAHTSKGQFAKANIQVDTSSTFLLSGDVQ